MRLVWLTLSIALVALGCSPGASTTKVEPPSSAPVAAAPTEPASPETAPSTSAPTTLAAPPPVTAKPEADPAPKKPSRPKPDPTNVAKADPALFGTYRLVLTAAQKKQLDDGIKDLEKRAADGDSQAQQMLPMAKQVAQATMNTTLVLGRDGRFRANTANQAATGVFTVSGNTVTMTPDEAQPGAPPATVLTYDKAARTLSTQAAEETIVFRKL